MEIEKIEKGKDKGKYQVTVEGFDYYNTITGNIESGGAEKIAMWMLDTDYDGRSLFPRQVFFPMAGDDEGWAKLARNLRVEIDEDLIQAYRGTVSLPFEIGKHKRAALKIIDARGIESSQGDQFGMTERSTIDRLIINSPYEEPQRYWQYNREKRTFALVEGDRRKAGYVIASESSRAFDDPGVFVEIPLVNQIRPRIRAWRKSGYSGVSGITKRLLEHWQNPEGFEARRFFFCQLEAIETLVCLAEAPESEKIGVEFPRMGENSAGCAARWRQGRERPL